MAAEIWKQTVLVTKNTLSTAVGQGGHLRLLSYYNDQDRFFIIILILYMYRRRVPSQGGSSGLNIGHYISMLMNYRNNLLFEEYLVSKKDFFNTYRNRKL